MTKKLGEKMRSCPHWSADGVHYGSCWKENDERYCGKECACDCHKSGWKMNPQKYKLLLTGGSGMLATELQETSVQHGIEYVPINRDDVDITHVGDMWWHCRRFVKDLGIHGVVHAAAYTNVPKSEIERERVIDVNINGTKNVVRGFCWPLDIPMIYISTDYVYEGATGNYKETDQIRPINFYGITKALGEEYVNLERDLVIRTSFKPNGKWAYPK
ncbi:hypothetical protein LCGC14_2706750, partial [marine sediment metagenome]